jgi:hypothetical protein
MGCLNRDSWDEKINGIQKRVFIAEDSFYFL